MSLIPCGLRHTRFKKKGLNPFRGTSSWTMHSCSKHRRKQRLRAQLGSSVPCQGLQKAPGLLQGCPCCSVTLIPQPLALAPQAWLCSSQISRKAAQQQAGCAASQEDKTCGSEVLKVPETSSVCNPSPPQQQSQAMSACRARRCDCQQPCSRVVLLPRPECDPPTRELRAAGLTSFGASLFSVCHLPLQDV